MSFGAFWGEIPVVVWDELDPVGESTFRRSLGLRHDVTTVYVAEQQFMTLEVEVPDNAERFAGSQDRLPALVDFMSTGSPTRGTPYERLPYRADLVFAVDLLSEANEDGYFPQRRVVVKDMFFSGLRIVGGEVGYRLLEVTLVDIRAFFGDYGEITRRWNERLPGGLTNFSARSLRTDGSSSRIRQIVQDCLNELPGQLQVIQCPQELFRPDVAAWAANPRDVIEGVLHGYGWVFGLDLAGTVSIYEAGQGGVGESQDGRGDNSGWDPVERKGIWEGAIRQDHYTFRAPVDLPQEVRVVGGPSIYTVAADYATPVIPVERINPDTGQAERRWLEVEIEQLREHLAPDGSLDEAGAEVFLRLPLSNPAIRGRIERKQQPPDFSTPTQREAAQRATQERQEAEESRWATVDEQALAQAKRNLGRFWQVPLELQGLLPVRDRAERFPDGTRQPPYVEACKTEPRKQDVTQTVRAQAQAVVDADRMAAREQLRLAGVQRGRIENRIRELELLDAIEILQYLDGILSFRREGARVIVSGQGVGAVANAFSEFADGAAALARDAVGPSEVPVQVQGPAPELAGEAAPVARVPYKEARKPFAVQTTRGEIDTERVLDTLKRYGMSVARTFISFDALTDVKAQAIDELRRQSELLSQRILELEKQVDPVHGLQLELALLRRKAAEIERPKGSGVGVVDLATRHEIELKEAEIQEAKAQLSIEAKYEGPFYKVIQAPTPRRPTSARVADRDQGVFELPEPAYWVNDPLSDNLSELVAVLMPVRLIFGTTNEPPGRPPEVKLNPFVQTAVGELIKDPSVAQAFGDLGHLVPNFEGGDQVAFTFSLDDPDTGGAEVGPAPFRIVIPDLRLFVELNGQSNYLELLIRARAAARAALGLPISTGATQTGVRPNKPGQRDGGSLTVVDPRPVNCNGRVTAVEISCSAERIETRLSFDSSVLPLPGIENPVRSSRPLELRFGLNLEAFS